MIRFALIVASTLGFVLTAALGNFMAPLLQELERFRPQEQQEPQTPVQSRVPALGGLCLMVSTLAAVGVGWTAACIAQPTLLGSESQLMTRLLIALSGPSGWRMTPPACAAAHSLACGVCPALHWKPPLRQRCWCCWQ